MIAKKSALTALVLMTLTLSAHAQMRGGGGGFGGGPPRQPTVWEQLALNAPTLSLTRDQKRSIEDLVDAFEKEAREIAGRDRAFSPEEQTRVAAAQEKMVVAIGQALTEPQREAWVAARAQAAQQAQRGGGFGGPGGGPGGPGGGGFGGPGGGFGGR